MNNNGSQTANPAIESSINQSSGQGSPLTADTRSLMENHFGTTFSNVRVHNNSNTVHINKQLHS